ncbi:septum formation initiator family protein [Bacillaceae bacterium IKA-2]|jgi:cell division protein DivIC|nr:septum formation initiator family protein [Bacillaceae bacterium IKA-2]
MKSAQQRKVREFNSSYREQQEIAIEKNSKSQKGLFRRLSALGIFVVIAILVTTITLHSQKSVLENSFEKKQQLEMEVARTQFIERDLLDEVKNLNNLEYISEIARRDYYLTKPGEIIFKITPRTSD